MSNVDGKYPQHPAASAFTLMVGDAFDRLVEDIKENGLIFKIILGKHNNARHRLDGHNRERACIEAGVKPLYDYYEGDDPVGYVKSVNITRRHMNDSQRAMAAKKLSTMTRGGDRSKPPTGALKTQRQAAQEHNVSEKAVERAAIVLKNGTPELIAAVEQEDVSLSRGAEIAKHSKAQQNDMIADSKSELGARTTVQRDKMMTIALLLKDSEVDALRAMCQLTMRSEDARARQGV